MLKSKILICALAFCSLVYAQENDGNLNQNQLFERVTALENANQSLSEQIRTLNDNVNGLKNQNAKIARLQKDVDYLTKINKDLQSSVDQYQQAIDSLSKTVSLNSANIKSTTESLGLKIEDANTAVGRTQNSLKSKTVWGVIAAIAVLLASIIVALILHKKGQKSSDDKIASLKQQADELNEKIVNQFAKEMEELQKVGAAVESTGHNSSAEPDHSLVKALADRITFMEMTLYRMDSSVKGHKQLSKSIIQMKDNLLANGYELVDMLGKEYNDGMKVTANFVEDENLEEGKQIITGIVKPQINYKGVMIQSAQITVSQN